MVILVYIYFIMFLVVFSLSIYKVKDGPVSLDIRVYTEFGGPKSSVQSTLIRQCYTINLVDRSPMCNAR